MALVLRSVQQFPYILRIIQWSNNSMQPLSVVTILFVSLAICAFSNFFPSKRNVFTYIQAMQTVYHCNSNTSKSSHAMYHKICWQWNINRFEIVLHQFDKANCINNSSPLHSVVRPSEIGINYSLSLKLYQTFISTFNSCLIVCRYSISSN